MRLTAPVLLDPADAAEDAWGLAFVRHFVMGLPLSKLIWAKLAPPIALEHVAKSSKKEILAQPRRPEGPNSDVEKEGGARNPGNFVCMVIRDLDLPAITSLDQAVRTVSGEERAGYEPEAHDDPGRIVGKALWLHRPPNWVETYKSDAVSQEDVPQGTNTALINLMSEHLRRTYTVHMAGKAHYCECYS